VKYLFYGKQRQSGIIGTAGIDGVFNNCRINGIIRFSQSLQKVKQTTADNSDSGYRGAVPAGTDVSHLFREELQ
jgi:hypothetical protein